MPILRVLKPKATLAPEIAGWHIENLAWLINTFGAPHLPRVPSIFKRMEPLSALSHSKSDERTPADWAQDVFGRTVSESRMENWTLSCRPSGPAPDEGLHAVSLTQNWSRHALGQYHVDILGNPVCLYREGDLSRDGAMSLSLILQLATLRLASAPAPDHYSVERHAEMIISMAVYNGQGLELLAMSDQLSERMVQAGWVKRAEVSNFIAELEFATVLSMSTRRLQPEQMIASYGPSLTRSFRKAIWAIEGQINAFGPEVKLLKLLADGESCSESAQISLRGTQELRATGS